MTLKWIRYISYCIATVFMVGCADSEDFISDIDESTSPYAIRIAVQSNSKINTRTSPSIPNDNLKGLQHVTRVQLHIFKETDNGSDFEFITTEDVKWSYLENAMAGDVTQEQKYVTKYQDYEPGVKYRFLAIGYDDTYTGSASNPIFDNANSVAAFGDPAQLFSLGDKLNDINFQLHFVSNDKGDEISLQTLNGSEVFAGSEDYTAEEIENGKASTVPLDLYRRVAGIAGYFENLPEYIEGSKVAKVVLRTYTAQNTKVNILPKYPETLYSKPADVPDVEYIDFITSSEILKYEVPEGSSSEENNKICEYIVSENSTENGKEGKVTLSAFMLPIKASEIGEMSTLYLEFVDDKDQKICERKILYSTSTSSDTRSGIGIIDPEGTEDDGGIAWHYPIRANHFYRMGHPDHPIDLSGSTSYILIQIDDDWDQYYGGELQEPDSEYETPSSGMYIDKAWGEHNGGKLDYNEDEN